MAKRVGLISINLVAGTAQFNADMGKAKAQIVAVGGAAKDASGHMISGMQASSAAIRVMEGGITNNLRAVERFVSGTLGLGPAMQAIFPIIGAIAFAGLIVSIGEKVYTFFRKSEEGAEKVRNAFRELNQSIVLSNDELRVANARLDSDIAKLEGKRQNNLAIALNEALVAADNLADSLGKDFEALNKLLDEQNVSALKGFFTHQGSTGWIKDLLADMEKQNHFTTDMASANMRAAVAKGDKREADQIAFYRDGALQGSYDATADQIEARLINQIQPEQDKRDRMKSGNWVADALTTMPADHTKEIADAKEVIRELREMSDHVALSAANETKKVIKTGLEVRNENDKLTGPLDDKLAQIGLQLAASQDRLAASGKTEEMKDLVNADIEAAKAIEEVNKGLARLHQKAMPKTTEEAIRLVERMIATNNAESKWNDSLAATTSRMEERTASYRDLAAAIGLSYEATKKANAEMAVKEFAKEKYGDAEWMASPDHAAGISRVRSDANDEFDAKHAEGVQSSLLKLNDQIVLEQRLARVQSEGEEAIRQVTLAAKIQAIQRDNDAASAEKLTRAELELYGAERLNAAAKNVSELDREIDATNRLAAARVEGAEQARRAELETKYSKMARAGATRGEIDTARQLDELKHQDALTESVLKTANAERNRLVEIDAEGKEAALLLNTDADQLGVMLKLRDLENERLKIMAQQLLAEGTARDGVRAFFLEMEQSAETTGQIIYNALNSAFGKLSDNLTQLVTGGKTKFGQMFKDIGRDMVDASIKKSLQKGLGALGKKLGIRGKGELTRKGQTPDTAIYVTPTGGTATPASTTPGAGPGSPNLKQLGGLFGGGGGLLGGLLQGLLHGEPGVGTAVDESITFGGMLAGGGDMSADKAYIAGEDGPEIIRRTSGTVMSNAASRKLVAGAGGNHYYTIDARGTDPALTEQRTKAAILAAHDAAVGTAVAATADNARRTPTRR